MCGVCGEKISAEQVSKEAEAEAEAASIKQCQLINYTLAQARSLACSFLLSLCSLFLAGARSRKRRRKGRERRKPHPGERKIQQASKQGSWY